MLVKRCTPGDGREYVHFHFDVHLYLYRGIFAGHLGWIASGDTECNSNSLSGHYVVEEVGVVKHADDMILALQSTRSRMPDRKIRLR